MAHNIMIWSDADAGGQKWAESLVQRQSQPMRHVSTSTRSDSRESELSKPAESETASAGHIGNPLPRA